MKQSKIALVWLLILNITTIYPCAHNVDPDSIDTVGYSVSPKMVKLKEKDTESTTYSRYELVSGTSIPNKKLVKMFFVKESKVEDISFVDITKRKNRKIKERLQEVRTVAAGLPSRGTRGGSEDKTLVYGNKRISPPLLIDKDFIDGKKAEEISFETIYDYISLNYEVEKGDEFHTSEMNLKLQNAVELGLKVLVVAVEQVDNGGNNSSIVMKIQDSVKVNTYATTQDEKNQSILKNYTREVVRIKGLELDMSSHGDWAFNIEGSSISDYIYNVVRSDYRETLKFKRHGAPFAYQNFSTLKHFTEYFGESEVNIQIPLADYTEDDDNSDILIARISE
ncbi:hypothetical protein N9N67_02045 [Bacteriovoracaceae bacterium]|nr:hypothetical protein [Bacteriovoracaceae bacterium]